MKKSSPAASVVLLGWLAFAACSSAPANPPQLGPCQVGDAGCPAVIVGGGTSGPGDEGGAGSMCTSSAGDAQCTRCASANCCAEFVACTANTDCDNLLSCEQGCTGGGCVTSCQDQAPNGAALLTILESCVDAKCPVCSEFGVGDPCGATGGTCNPGLACSGLWCTKGCVRSTDCVGLGAGGGNALGLPGECVATGAAAQCVPGCAGDSDCSAFPGSYCFATTSFEGLSVRVCAAPPDAGAD